MELTQREKTWILLAVVILLPLLFMRLVLSPLNDYSQKQRSTVTRLQNKINQIDQMGQKLRHLERTRTSQTGSLSKRVDRMLRQHQLRTRSRTIVDSNPDGRQRLVLKLEEVNLTELIKILYAVENASPVIAIKSIDINPAYKNKKRFRVSCALSSW